MADIVAQFTGRPLAGGFDPVLTGLIRPVFNVKDYGAKGDGTTNDRTALFDADAAVPSTGGDIYLPPGTYLVNSNLTFNAKSRILRANGATLKVATGVTVTINGPFESPLSKAFDLVGTGVVAFGAGALRNREVYAEWWGATATVGIQEALNAVSAGGTVRLSQQTYTPTSPLTMSNPGVNLIGGGQTATIIEGNPGSPFLSVSGNV